MVELFNEFLHRRNLAFEREYLVVERRHLLVNQTQVSKSEPQSVQLSSHIDHFHLIEVFDPIVFGRYFPFVLPTKTYPDFLRG